MMIYHDIFSRGVSLVDENGVLTIVSAPSRYVMWAIVFVVGIPAMRLLWKKGVLVKYTRAFFFALFTIPLIALPGLRHEKIVCDGQKIEVATGFWFDPNEYGVELPREVEFTGYNTLKLRGKKRLVLEYANGERVELAMSDLVAGNVHVLVDYLQGYQ